MTQTAQETTHFGYETVTTAEKKDRVGAVFSSVARDYDRMNDAMSMGVHRLWKDRLIREIAPRPLAHRPLQILDVAGGTGDIAFRLHDACQRHSTDKTQPASITIADINPDMLEVGKDRATDRGLMTAFTWQEANAEQLPFEDNSFDLYTIAFGLRNVTHIDTALAEVARVLRPGGRFFCLEFSRVVVPPLRELYDAYSFGVIPKLGQAIAKDRDSYQYLVESIRQFPNQAKLCAMMRSAGMKHVRHTNLSAGVVAIHQGVKVR